MKIVSGMIRVLLWVVYAVIAAALLLNVPIVGGYRPVVILSGSMKPAYPVGSIIYYKKAAFQDIKVGDAITMRLGEDSLATHRVVEKNETNQEFTTKGDNNPTPDNEPVSYERVVGKATAHAIPYVGYFTRYIQNWYTIAFMGLILILDMVLGSKREGKKKGEKIDIGRALAERRLKDHSDD